MIVADKKSHVGIRFPKLSTRKVWVGAYGGHYDVITIYRKKPRLIWLAFEDERSYSDEHLIGTFSTDTWDRWFGGIEILVEKGILDPENYNRPFDTQVRKVAPLWITAPFDEHGYLDGYVTEADHCHGQDQTRYESDKP